MRSAFGSKFAVLALGSWALGSLALMPAALAQSDSDSSDPEEIVITHSKLGPLSEWAQMQQHTADYQRLKAKFDPTTGSSHTDNWANDRALASHSNSSDSFMQESADAPTPPVVQAIKDAVVPP